MEGVPQDQCLICQGKLDGLYFCRATICSACIKTIVQSSPGDPGYDYLVGRIKEFWDTHAAWSV